ncbi:MAG TPA: tetratricopeptide repeat protein, partial [Longimicrobiaceae bacterium]
EERESIRRICTLVGGLPLAIDLASPWVRLLPCAEIEGEIEESGDFLDAQSAALPARHRSLRSTFEWSWRHLDDDERRALGRLAVFRGGFSRAAAREVADAGLPMLSALADQSLIRVAAPGRYEMLELLARFAEAELRRNPADEGDARTRHLRFYAGLMREVIAEHRERPGEHAVRDQVGDELRNLRRAAKWAVEQGEVAELEALLMGAFLFYDAQGRALEGAERFREAADAVREMAAAATDDGAADRLLGATLLRHGVFLVQLGRRREAQERLLEGLERARAHADRRETAFALQHLAGQAVFAGEYEHAEGMLNEEMEIREALGEPRGNGPALSMLGNLAYMRGDLARAEELYGRAVEILRASGESGLLFAPLCNLGIIAAVRHDYATARLRMSESLTVARAAGNPRRVANALQNLGNAAWQAGDHAAAEAHLGEAVAICREMGFRRLLAFCLNSLGNVFVARGELGRGAEACAEALAIAAEIGEAPLTLEVVMSFARLRRREARDAEAAELVALLRAHPATDPEARASAAELEAELKAALPSPDFAAALERGRAAELDAIVARLLESASTPQPASV